jgi:hypothetical protein
MEQSSRPARKVAISDHIWDAFEEMSQAMGSDRDGLINQAMFMFARLNGFLENAATSAPARPAGGAAKPQPVRAAPPVAPVGRPSEPPVARMPPREELSSNLDEDPARREVAERVLETAAELERLIKGKNAPPPPMEEDEESLDEGEDSLGHGDPDESEEGALYLMAEGGELDKIDKERFVIGRGKHCDFVINSGKVSREHAAIMREGEEWFIEDLGSSNGTWFNKQRIKRRKIEDGDEYFICSEKVKFVYR